jgi:hypothetical protein
MAEPTPQTFRLAASQAKRLTFTMDEFPDDDPSVYDMRFRLRRRGGDVLIEKTSAAGITYTGDADTTASWDVTIDADDTYPADPDDHIRPGQYEWSLWRVDDGEENPMALGTCTVYRTAETG